MRNHRVIAVGVLAILVMVVTLVTAGVVFAHNGGVDATVSGSSDNHAHGDYSSVGGGRFNQAITKYTTIAGGWKNKAKKTGSTVGGGIANKAIGTKSTVGGGQKNTASGLFATVPGGNFNTASGAYSFAAGRRAQALHDGSFVWGGSTNADFTSTGNDQFLIRAPGGVGIGTASPISQLHLFEDVNGTVNLVIENPNGGLSSAERITFRNEDGNAAGINLRGDPSRMLIFNNRPGARVELATAGTPRLTVANNGDVGIGTTNPGEKLDVTTGNIRTIGQFISTVATGTAPLSVASNTKVTNLNVDLLDGLSSNSFAPVAHDHDSAYVNTTGDTMTGALTLPNNGLTVGTNQLAISGGNVGIGNGSPDRTLDVSGTARITGEVDMPAMDVSFYAYNSFADTIGSGTFKVEFDAELHDDGADFNTSLDRFVAPANGVYHFDTSVEFSSLADGARIIVQIRKNGTVYTRFSRYANTSSNFQSFGGSTVMKLLAKDEVEVFIFSADASSTIRGNSSVTFFAGHRLY